MREFSKLGENIANAVPSNTLRSPLLSIDLAIAEIIKVSTIC
jgi:hypothetical protein